MQYFICLLAVVAVAVAYPQREGAAFTNEAIQQAQNSYLIPRDAQIQNVSIRLMGKVKLRNYFFFTF